MSDHKFHVGELVNYTSRGPRGASGAHKITQLLPPEGDEPRLYERTSIIVTTNLAFGEWPRPIDILALKLVLFRSLVSPLGEKFVAVSQLEQRLLGFGLDRFSCDLIRSFAEFKISAGGISPRAIVASFPRRLSSNSPARSTRRRSTDSR